MQQTKEMAKASKRMGKKIMATDTAQDVVAVVVDGLEGVAVDKADDVAESVKTRAARAGGRSPKRASAGKTDARTPKKTAKKSTAKRVGAKRAGAKKSTARKSTAKKSTAKRVGAKRAGAKKSTARKSTAKKSTAKRR
jgi:DNA-binding protein HU-beta